MHHDYLATIETILRRNRLVRPQRPEPSRGWSDVLKLAHIFEIHQQFDLLWCQWWLMNDGE